MDYMVTCIVGLVFIYGYNIVSAILRGMGDSRRPFVFVGVAAVLNRFGARLTVVAGNCDDGADLKMLKFPAARDRAVLTLGGRTFFLTHGHIWNGWNPPPVPAGSVLVHGHTHVPEATETAGGIIIFNPGSIGAPRRGAPRSFGCLEDGRLAVRRLDDGGEIMNFELAAGRRDPTAG